jgi:histidinol-phosphate aminotransferase
LKDSAYYDMTTAKVVSTRGRFTRELRRRGFTVADSAANFVFASHCSMSGGDIFKALRERGILVRHFRKPVIDNYLRISIGTDEEMDTVISALNDIMKGN